MTAGRGIVHSERTPQDLVLVPHRTHGLQLWVALPKAHEEDEPDFTHTPQADILVVQVGGNRWGRCRGNRSGFRCRGGRGFICQIDP